MRFVSLVECGADELVVGGVGEQALVEQRIVGDAPDGAEPDRLARLGNLGLIASSGKASALFAIEVLALTFMSASVFEMIDALCRAIAVPVLPGPPATWPTVAIQVVATAKRMARLFFIELSPYFWFHSCQTAGKRSGQNKCDRRGTGDPDPLSRGHPEPRAGCQA